MNYENPIRMVRELKGAPLSVIFALSLVQNRVTQEWLERTTGYTDKPVSQALAYLREIGMVDHTSAGWQLTNGVQQLPLPVGQIEDDGDPIENESYPQPPVDKMPELLTECEESRKNSDSHIYMYINKDINNNLNNIYTGRKNSDSDTISPELGEAFREVGLKGPKAEYLALLPWVTPDYVRDLDSQLRRQKGGDYKTGLLVWSLENQVEAKSPDRDRNRNRYSEWEDMQQ